ncbi:MAG: response regulator transcription factor [Brevinematales bacterium]|nr:response regulator transcription factor [Brevinematales bacterium]
MSIKKRIYILEDEIDVANLVKINLEKDKYSVNIYTNSSDFLTEVSKQKPDLAILDLMLPDIDGIEVCKFLKKDGELSKIPVIMLTAKSEEIDKILGLEIGADDYITKPFSVNELKARIKAVLRRYSSNDKPKEGLRHIDDYTIDFNKFEVTYKGQKIQLTTVEFKIIDLLSQKRGWVYSREQIIDYLWGHEKYPTERTIDVHINNLRKKLGELGEKIINVRGIGYKLEE